MGTIEFFSQRDGEAFKESFSPRSKLAEIAPGAFPILKDPFQAWQLPHVFPGTFEAVRSARISHFSKPGWTDVLNRK